MCRCLCIGTTLREEAAAETRKGHGRNWRAFLGPPASTRAGDHVVTEAPRLRAALVPRQAAHCNARVRSARGARCWQPEQKRRTATGEGGWCDSDE